MVLTVEQVEERSASGRILDPEDLVVDLLLSTATDFVRRGALLGQVSCARRRGLKHWLEQCAGFCHQYGFGMMSPEWTEAHIGPIPEWARSHSGRPGARRAKQVEEGGDAGTSGVPSDNVRKELAGISSRQGIRDRSPAEEEGWQEVRQKRVRRWSPIKWDRQEFKREWDKKKVVMDARDSMECFRCRKLGHYASECQNEWKCNNCRRYGHRAFECGEQRVPVAGTSSSGAMASVADAKSGMQLESLHVSARAEDEGSREKEEVTSISGQVHKDRRRSRQKGFRACRVPWCAGNFCYKKAHTFDAHFPTALAAQEGDDTRTALRIEALEFLARTFVGREASLNDLVNHLNQVLAGRDPCSMDEWTKGVARKIAEWLGMEVPETFTCTPINSPGCIFQYQVWLDAMSRLTKVEHDALQKEFSTERNPLYVELKPAGISCGLGEDLRVEIAHEGEERGVHVVQAEDPECLVRAGISCQKEEYEEDRSDNESQVIALSLSDSKSTVSNRPWRHERSPHPSLSDMEIVDEVGSDDEGEGQVIYSSSEKSPLSCVDSHFHLDRLCLKLRIRPRSFKKAIKMLAPLETSVPSVDGAVAVWCDPETYPSKSEVEKLREEGVVSTLGIHPSKVGTGDVSRLREMIDSYPVVGIGEVGIDGTHREPQLQRMVLEEVLLLAKERKHLTLVLHCRPGPRELNTHLYYELFYACKGALSPEQKIHLHCFNGSVEVVTLWLGYFPNTYFGYSLMVAGPDFGADSKLALSRLDGSRILIETDAPYFPNRREGYEWSSPAFIAVVADAVAQLRGIGRQELLKLTASNARRLYWG